MTSELPARRRIAAGGLLLLPLAGLYLFATAIFPGLRLGPLIPAMAVLALLASAVVLVAVLRAPATPGTRAIGVLGTVAPPAAAFLYQVSTYQLSASPDGRFMAGPGVEYVVRWHIERYLPPTVEVTLLVLGFGLPLLAGLRWWRPDPADGSAADLGVLALLLIPPAGLVLADLLAAERLLGRMRLELLVVAVLAGLVLVVAAALLFWRGRPGVLTGTLVALAVLAAPAGVVMLSQPQTRVTGYAWQDERTAPSGRDWSRAMKDLEAKGAALPAAAHSPAPFWVPLHRSTRLGLVVLLLGVLPLLAVWRTGRLRGLLLGARR